MSHAGWARLKTVCGLVVAMIGLSALAGWGTGQRRWRGSVPTISRWPRIRRSGSCFWGSRSW